MKSKKVIAAVLIAATCVGIGIKGIKLRSVFVDTLKQDVVYNQDNEKNVSKKSYDLTEEENKAIKSKCEEIMVNQFNESADAVKKFTYTSIVMNKDSLGDLEKEECGEIKAQYDNKQMSKEEYEKYTAEVPNHYKELNKTVDELKHGFIQTTWIENGELKYIIDFNENTKEAEMVTGDMSNADKQMKFSKDKLKSIADEFINKNKIGNLKKPKFIRVGKRCVYYEDEDNKENRVCIEIDPCTGKVNSYSANSFEKMLNNRKNNN